MLLPERLHKPGSVDENILTCLHHIAPWSLLRTYHLLQKAAITI
jgi:hypothetical protein